MGSIAAILTRSAPLDTGVVRQMLAAAPHRGTDLNIRICGNCILGVSNKSDFTDSTISSEGPLMAALSGRLDNASELIKTLSPANHWPASINDADIVVAAFKAFGPDAPNRMRGEFTGVVSDGRQVWCFRDHVGLKPLFYRNDARAFFVGHEPKQIIAGAGLRREPDTEVLEQIFYGQMSADLPSALKGVSRIPPATVLNVDDKGTSTQQLFWNPASLLETARFSSAEISDRFSELFAQAVDRSLTGEDVISLSGGIDSPAVAAFAAPQHLQRTGQPISALSMVFPDLPAVDERSYIELVAKHHGIKLHTYQIRARVLDDLMNWCSLLDGPVPRLAVPEISENYGLARQLGFRNILTGELAEFLFTFRRHTLGHLLVHRRWRALMQLALMERRRGVAWKKIGQQVLAPIVPGRLAIWYLHMRGLDYPNRIPDWLDRRKVNERAPYRSDLLQPARSRWSGFQLTAFNGCTITMDAGDLCAALNGVTVRRPFADIDLWEFFLSLPAEDKFPDLGLKTLVRQLLRGKVPDPILDRRDKTFFDDHIMAQVNYPLFRQFLVESNHQIDGVDYHRLTARLDREDFTLIDWLWANDLVRIHAFLSLW